MSHPRVSVIIPVYNGERYVVGAVESALAQTYPDVEIIIINDGSVDGSREKLASYIVLPNVVYIEQINQGVAAARNAGIRRATGEFIGFLDQDDVWLPKKLELQISYLENHPQIPLVHANVRCIDESGQNIDYQWDTRVEGMCFRYLFERNRIAVVTVLVRKECLRQVGVFNERLPGVDDYELWLRISRKFPIGRIDDVVALYRFHASNVSRDSFDMTFRELAAIQSVVDAFPDVHRVLGKRIVSERVAHLHFQLGGWYMWKAREFQLARQHFCRAIKLRPRHLASYRRFLWCALTPAGRRAIDWYWCRLKRCNLFKDRPSSARRVS